MGAYIHRSSELKSWERERERDNTLLLLASYHGISVQMKEQEKSLCYLYLKLQKLHVVHCFFEHRADINLNQPESSSASALKCSFLEPNNGSNWRREWCWDCWLTSYLCAIWDETLQDLQSLVYPFSPFLQDKKERPVTHTSSSKTVCRLLQLKWNKKLENLCSVLDKYAFPCSHISHRRWKPFISVSEPNRQMFPRFPLDGFQSTIFSGVIFHFREKKNRLLVVYPCIQTLRISSWTSAGSHLPAQAKSCAILHAWSRPSILSLRDARVIPGAASARAPLVNLSICLLIMVSIGIFLV